jgi:endonuclease-8
MYSCSLKYLEEKHASKTYDFSVDVMSDDWQDKQALRRVLANPNEQIADVLLDQTIFAGVGNIIKNEILFMAKVHPESLVSDIPEAKLRKLVKLARDFSQQFYAWRKEFVLRKNLIIYRKSTCPVCSGKVVRRKTGSRARWSFYCPQCQKIN